MRRTAAWLILPLYLCVRRVETEWPAAGPWLAGHGFGLFDLLPLLMLAGSTAARRYPVQSLLQGLGGGWLLAAWGAALAFSGDAQQRLVLGIPFLGLSLLSLYEAGVHARRPSTTDPERRFAIALLAILTCVEMVDAWDGAQWLQARYSFSGILRLPEIGDRIGPSVGRISLYILAAWGTARSVRWAPWAGTLAAGFRIVLDLWQIGSRRGPPWSVSSFDAETYFTWYFAIHLTAAAMAILLIRLFRRAKPELAAATPTSPEP